MCKTQGECDARIGRLNGLFNLIYADSGRAPIAPEKLLRAMLVQVLFPVTSSPQAVTGRRVSARGRKPEVRLWHPCGL